jgi:predicted nucleic acid-binding protein
VVTYLLDTNVVSETTKRKANAHVLEWFDSVTPEQLHVSVLVLGEVRRGIEGLRTRDPARAEVIENFLTKLIETYGDRIVAVTADIAQEWGRLDAKRKMPPADGLMAATAKVHDWVFVTRNTRDVEASGVRVLDPFTGT